VTRESFVGQRRWVAALADADYRGRVALDRERGCSDVEGRLSVSRHAG